jgi:hypothetical protein
LSNSVQTARASGGDDEAVGESVTVGERVGEVLVESLVESSIDGSTDVVGTGSIVGGDSVEPGNLPLTTSDTTVGSANKETAASVAKLIARSSPLT